jgi:hypothetical protein
MRHYFIGFAYWRKNGDMGIASASITREFPVLGWDDILEITNIIYDRNQDYENIVALNWRRFEDPE